MSEPKKMEEKTSRERALIAARAADEKKATDIMVQEVRDLIGVTDYFVIATAANNRQVEAIVDEIEEAERVQGGCKPLHREGTQDGTWSLLDYGDIVVHVFLSLVERRKRIHPQSIEIWNYYLARSHDAADERKGRKGTA